MPAQSKAQQRFMGMVHAAQKGELDNPSKDVVKVAKDMKKSDAKDFASTSHKGLPNHVKQEILKKLKEYALTLPGHNIKPAAPAQSLDDLEGVNESTNPREDALLKTFKNIVDTHSSLKVKDGGRTILVDVQSANIVLKLYDALSDKNKQSLLKMPIGKMIKMAWHVMGKK